MSRSRQKSSGAQPRIAVTAGLTEVVPAIGAFLRVAQLSIEQSSEPFPALPGESDPPVVALAMCQADRRIKEVMFVTISAADPPAVSPKVVRFIEYSVDLTGFTRFDLYATGMAELYYDTVLQQLGLSDGEDLIGGPDAGARRLEISEATRLEAGRAITYLWYTGAWPRIAPAAHAELRRQQANTEFVVSPDAYTEGLVWRAFGGHPAGAKPPGFGTWSDPPSGLSDLDEITADIEAQRRGFSAGTAEAKATAAATVQDPTAPALPEAAEKLATLLPGPAWAYFVTPSEHPLAAEPNTLEGTS
jgi:hypothetical protein